MRGVVDVEPDLGRLLPGRDEPAYAVGEDLRAASGERSEPGCLELAQHLLVREARERRHVVDLGGRVALEVHVGKRVVQRGDRVAVEGEVDVRVLAVDHVDLGEPGHLALSEHVLDELLGRERVRVLLLARRGEGAELALHAADVRLVQVQVLDEVHLVRAAARAAREVGERAELEQVVRLEDRDAVVEVEALSGLDLLPDRLQRLQLENGDQLLLSTTARVNASSSSGAARRRGRTWPPKRSGGPARETGRAHRSPRRGRGRPPSGLPRARRARPGPRCAASSSGSVGVPSRRSVPGTLPVSIVSPVQSRTSSAIWKAMPRRRPYSPLPPPRTHAASKSFPVFSEQRSR